MVETPVGDRYVLEAMLAGQRSLGGEQSGHIILADYATTGDGVLTALHLLAVLARRGVSLAEAAKVMTRYPQVLINVPVDRTAAAASPELAQAVEAAREELGSTGRILVRPSGTEPIIRVMVEAVDTAQADRVARPGRRRGPTRPSLNSMREAREVVKVRAAEAKLMAALPAGTLMQRAATGLAAVCGQLLGRRSRLPGRGPGRQRRQRR